MSANSIKTNQQEEKRSFFSYLDRIIDSDKLMKDGIPASLIPKVLFVVAILLFYIGNTHFAERTIRQIELMKVRVDDLRADYTTLKAELMFSAKQSEVAKKVSGSGLKETQEPPFKIMVRDK